MIHFIIARAGEMRALFAVVALEILICFAVNPYGFGLSREAEA